MNRQRKFTNTYVSEEILFIKQSTETYNENDPCKLLAVGLAADQM